MSLNEQEAMESKDSEHSHENVSPETTKILDQQVDNAREEHPQAGHSLEEHPQEEHHHKDSKHQQVYDALLAELEKISDPEAKLEKTIAFMEGTLSHGATPHFKSFWGARNLSLELFKQNISAATRANLWAKYTELSKEARRLKDILEEQSAFAAEQIDIAIKALENDIDNNTQTLSNASPLEFEAMSKSLEPKMDTYFAIQRELNLLNAQAARINALRKELIRTEMRIRQKNKFFQRLSVAGDKVFPRRKELIKDVSQYFMEDIDSFILENFAKGEIHDSLFFLREEIKSLQGLAKLLTLNTHAFTHTRLRLSECWDKIKLYEKDRKKARANQKVIFKKNMELVQQKLKEILDDFNEGRVSIAETSKKFDEITLYMRQVELGREEVNALKEELAEARKPLLDRIKAEENERVEHEQERERLRKERYQELRLECDALLKKIDELDGDVLAIEKDNLLENISTAPINKIEKQDLERLLKPLRDIIADKKERALLDLSEDDKAKLQHLKELLKEKKERRQEIKNQLEIFRKAQGNSGMDFEQAMSNKSQIAAEKERLEKINGGIKEIECRIKEIEKRSVA